MSVVSTAVYSLAIWTRGSHHSSSPGSFLLTAAQIRKQWKCSKITLDLSVECHEEGSVARLLSYSKYTLLSNYNFLTVCHGRFKRVVVLGLFVNDRSISVGVVRMYSLLNPFPIKGMYVITSFYSYSILYPRWWP